MPKKLNSPQEASGPVREQSVDAIAEKISTAIFLRPSSDPFATVPVNAEPSQEHDFAIVDLPAMRAATIVHRGSMDNVMPTIQTLARWIDAHGYRSGGYNRELYLEIGEDRDTWVTELQEPIL